jgi:hypothetical protein
VDCLVEGDIAMRKKITIEKAERQDNKLVLFPAPHSFSLEEAKAKNYMLVDSDELAFIYIIEADNEFIYTSIPKSLWRELNEALKANIPVFLKDEKILLELSGMADELAYLIDNIEGNANYGEEMEKAVKETFHV